MMFKNFVISLLRTWAWLAPVRRWRVERIPDEPAALQPRVLYLVGEHEPWVAVFQCPCGCKKSIWLNLLKEHRPRWKVATSQNGFPTVSPSINRQVGCRSHFLLISGKIKWC